MRSRKTGLTVVVPLHEYKAKYFHDFKICNSGFSIDNSVQILTDKTRVNLSEYTSRVGFYSLPITMCISKKISILTQHIPPKWVQYIRRYGLYSSRTENPGIIRYAPSGWKANELKLLENEKTPKETEYNISSIVCRKAWARMLAKKYSETFERGGAGTPWCGHPLVWTGTLLNNHFFSFLFITGKLCTEHQ